MDLPDSMLHLYVVNTYERDTPVLFNWRGWYRAGFPFFQGDMTVNAQNPSSWISTGGDPQPSCVSFTPEAGQKSFYD
ncbi:hypothetical protein J6590_018954 [Homalodisca vitripennis]|nr:hypothetical protein J6590_018954 [Homalodisca vitripennis]